MAESGLEQMGYVTADSGEAGGDSRCRHSRFLADSYLAAIEEPDAVSERILYASIWGSAGCPPISIAFNKTSKCGSLEDPDRAASVSSSFAESFSLVMKEAASSFAPKIIITFPRRSSEAV